MLSKTKGKELTEYLSDYVIFDLETTGISCYRDKVVEISGVKVIKGTVTDEFSHFVNPECHIPFPASQVNGITDEMVSDAPLFNAILKDFLDFAGELPLVGHNIASFDMKFIYRDSEKYYGMVPGNDYIDTLRLSRICLPSLKHHTLTDLATYYGISTAGAHRALNDCRMNQAVYEKLGEILSERLKDVNKCPRCGSILVIKNLFKNTLKISIFPFLKPILLPGIRILFSIHFLHKHFIGTGVYTKIPIQCLI